MAGVADSRERSVRRGTAAPHPLNRAGFWSQVIQGWSPGPPHREDLVAGRERAFGGHGLQEDCSDGVGGGL